MRRLSSLCPGVVAAILLTAAAVWLPSARAAPGLRPSTRALEERVSPCIPEYTKVASPDVLLLGETVDVTLTVRAICAGERMNYHFVFVLDGSAGMAGDPRKEMKEAAVGVIRGLDLAAHPSTKVSVVEFNSAAVTCCGLTGSQSRAIGCVRKVNARGGSAIDAGIEEGMRVLAHGRLGLDRESTTEVMLLFSRGDNDEGCQAAVKAALQARGQGMLMIAVCAGRDCNEACMRQVAGSSRYYFRAAEAERLRDVFEQIRYQLLNVVIRDLQVRDALPAHMAYVPGSARPTQSQPEDPRDWLMWQEEYVPREGVTYTYRARPLVAGTMPTNLQATGRIVDNKGRVKEWAFPSPWVTVLQPDLVPPPGALPAP